MFILNAWYVAAWADEITTQPMARRICKLAVSPELVFIIRVWNAQGIIV